MSELSIRTMCDSDLEAVLGLLGELNEHAHASSELSPDRAKETLGHMKSNPGSYNNAVAVLDGKIVGFLSMIFYRSLFHKVGTALINELVVSKPYRKMGVGKALVAEATSRAMRDGLDEIEVGTEVTNKGALAFYRKAGFDEEYVLLGKEFAHDDRHS